MNGCARYDHHLFLSTKSTTDYYASVHRVDTQNCPPRHETADCSGTAHSTSHSPPVLSTSTTYQEGTVGVTEN